MIYNFFIPALIKIFLSIYVVQFNLLLIVSLSELMLYKHLSSLVSDKSISEISAQTLKLIINKKIS